MVFPSKVVAPPTLSVPLRMVEPRTPRVEVGAEVEDSPTPTFPPTVSSPPTLMVSVVVAELKEAPLVKAAFPVKAEVPMMVRFPPALRSVQKLPSPAMERVEVGPAVPIPTLFSLPLTTKVSVSMTNEPAMVLVAVPATVKAPPILSLVSMLESPRTTRVLVGLTEERPIPTFPPVVRNPPTRMVSVLVAELKVVPSETDREPVEREEPEIVVWSVVPIFRTESMTPSPAEKYLAEEADPAPWETVAAGAT